MPIEKWSEQVTVVRLSDDPQFTEDLESLQELSDAQRNGMVLDFSGVRFVNSSNIAKLLNLRMKMSSAGQKLVLCALPTQLWGTFLTTGLDKVFEFSDNVTTALATVQIADR
jgi:anti-anti-sigma factor